MRSRGSNSGLQSGGRGAAGDERQALRPIISRSQPGKSLTLRTRPARRVRWAHLSPRSIRPVFQATFPSLPAPLRRSYIPPLGTIVMVQELSQTTPVSATMSHPRSAEYARCAKANSYQLPVLPVQFIQKDLSRPACARRAAAAIRRGCRLPPGHSTAWVLLPASTVPGCLLAPRSHRARRPGTSRL
jgi:hypothetical protein